MSEHPEDDTRYGEAGFDWCVHDNQWILGWAADDVRIGRKYLHKNIEWLAGLLGARDFPIEHLVRDLEIAAEVVHESNQAGAPLVDRLRASATMLRQRKRPLREDAT